MTPEEKRKAYYAIPSATRKEMAEMNVFTGFATAAGLDVDPGSAKKEKPPVPDISCAIEGEQQFFELGEVTDEEFAEQIGVAQRTLTDGEGGFQSEEAPLVRMILKKAQSTYETAGAPVDLVLHFDKQYPFAPVDHLSSHGAEIATAMVPKGPFSRIWIYNGWDRSIMWRRG